ncbi:MAG TPA: ATP-binding cassette domain-containing protein [Casimicrobiaceae bacterium]|nr:ATP-binding cassette domain-containing protein [Casimicrobiaceae bacterium]
MFEVTGIDFRYGDKRALKVDGWTAATGDAWLLAGPSGSGKSTLLHLLAGLLRSRSGRIIVAGTDLGTLPANALDRWRGRTIGLVPQRLHLIGAISVRDNLRVAQSLGGGRVDDARVDELLDAVAVGALADRYPRALSHGQAQRVAIARALVNRPALVLADEPTSNLDDANAIAALALLTDQARASRATLVVASHDRRARAQIGLTYTLAAEMER